jgi:hypothetical protein
MLYKLLGMAVWKGGRMFVRRRYGSKPLIAGAAVAAAAVAVAGGVALAASRRGD